MNERGFAKNVVALTVAAAFGAFFYVWAELNWKNLGGRSGVAPVALLGAALGALFGHRMARRPTPIDWIFELVRSLMLAVLVSGLGALVAYLGDMNPKGAVPAAFTSNLPNASTPVLTTLLIAMTVLATSSVLPIWRHRHAVRVFPERPLAETLAVCAAWLSLVVAVLAVTGLVIGLDLARALVPISALALALFAGWCFVALVVRPRRFEPVEIAFAISGGALAFSGLVAGLTGFPLPGREPHRDGSACLATGHAGLFRDARATRVTAYRARGVALRRVDCRTTFQYNDERLTVVVGRDQAGRDVLGAELFVRVVGTPLERARAACEILLADRCQAPLAFPSELAGFSGKVPTNDILVPHERDGRLAFLAVTYEYPVGR